MSVQRPSGPVIIRVIVREGTVPGEGTIIHDQEGDHAYSHFRDWIANTEWWAMRNGKNVVKYPLEN